jgi:ribosomal protein S18 acetylase RimI-like enzyme
VTINEDTIGIRVRKLQIRDLKDVNRMGPSFPMPFFRRPRPFDIRWLVTNLALLMSICNTLRRLMLLVFPRQAFLPIVAVSNEGQILGFAFLLIKRTSRRGGFIARLVVGTKVQGQGIGDQLLRALIAQAQQEGVCSITLSVSPNNTKAISLYKKYGFEKKTIDMSLDLRQ